MSAWRQSGCTRHEGALSGAQRRDDADALGAGQLEAKTHRSGSGVLRRGRACSRREGACDLSPACVCGRGALPDKKPGRGRGWARLCLAGRGLRRKFLRARSGQHSRFLPRVPADGGGADLRRKPSGREDRAYRGAVRQAALGADRKAERRRSCRATGATSSTTSRSRTRRARPIRRGC